ncbi:hypothetical protein AXX12_09610 [Anaerosporomusa subterranea]|uniref:Uncharacterized protein n=1 Tax=Anaerosporomusa subterranea TaxID=1794912 RepID=A0A154BRT7_ANASB|nr:hypothetical protein AXX12_09610 [Anaerosporomusa subterranea]
MGFLFDFLYSLRRTRNNNLAYERQQTRLFRLINKVTKLRIYLFEGIFCAFVQVVKYIMAERIGYL